MKTSRSLCRVKTTKGETWNSYNSIRDSGNYMEGFATKCGRRKCKVELSGDGETKVKKKRRDWKKCYRDAEREGKNEDAA